MRPSLARISRVWAYQPEVRTFVTLVGGLQVATRSRALASKKALAKVHTDGMITPIAPMDSRVAAEFLCPEAAP